MGFEESTQLSQATGLPGLTGTRISLLTLVSLYLAARRS